MIHIHIPSIPPSINHAYVRTKGGGRALSEEGKKYKAETADHLVRQYPTEMMFFKKNVPYLMMCHLTFKNAGLLLIKGYPKKTDNRYKKLDVSNRIKLLEDAVSRSTGVDDCHNWTVVIRKCVGDEDSTHLWFWNLDDEPHNAITNTIDTYLSIAKNE